MSLLTIVQRAVKQVKVITSDPTTVIGNNDPDIQQAQELLFEVGESLKINYNWQQLVRQATFTTSNGTTSYALSTVVSDGDLDSFIGDCMYDTTSDREVRIVGVNNYQNLVSTVNSSAGIDKTIAQYEDSLHIYPTPTSTDTISLFYKSTQWITSSGGTGQDNWLADTDTSRFPEYLLQLGLVALLRREFGLPYAEQQNVFIGRAEAEAEKNRIKQTLYQQPYNNIPVANVPDTGFGS